MCLSTISWQASDVEAEDAAVQGFGYKIFTRGCSSGKMGEGSPVLFFLVQGRCDLLPIGEWMDEKIWRDPVNVNRSSLVGDASKKYPFGFHIFTVPPLFPISTFNRQQLWRVEYANVVARGSQFDSTAVRRTGKATDQFSTLVAKQMRVLKHVPELQR